MYVILSCAYCIIVYIIRYILLCTRYLMCVFRIDIYIMYVFLELFVLLILDNICLQFISTM